MIALLLLVTVLLGDRRSWPVELELEGPLDAVMLDLGPAGVARLEGGLVAGERRRVALPLPLTLPSGVEGAALPAVVPEVDGTGRARLVGWGAAAELEALPAGLVRRPRPPAPATSTPPRGASLALAAALLAAALLAPRRVGPWIALAGAPLLVVVAARARTVVPSLVVVDADLDAGAALRVEALADAAHWSGTGWLEVEPTGAPLELVHDLRADPPTTRARLLDGGGALWLLRREPVGPGDDPAARLGLGLERRWTRAADGTWDASAEPPPGWLVAGLPLGVTVLLGRTPDGTWLRATGGR